jgi:hypothetical protein
MWLAGRQWLIPIILATQEAEIKRIKIQNQPREKFVRPYLKKTHHKKGLVEWLKVEVLSSSPSTRGEKKKSYGYS